MKAKTNTDLARAQWRALAHSVGITPAELTDRVTTLLGARPTDPDAALAGARRVVEQIRSEATRAAAPALVALPGAAPDAATGLGQLVSWERPPAQEPTWGALLAALMAEGLDESWAPRPPSARRALGLAVRPYQEASSVRKGSRSRAVAARPRGGAYVLVRETLDQEEIDVRLGAARTRVWLDASERLQIEPADDRRAPAIRDAYRERLEHEALDRTKISAWLVECAYRLGAVSWTEAGGVYHLPPDAADRWARVCRAAEAARARGVRSIVVARTADAVRYILSAYREHVAAALAAVREHAEAALTGEAGPRAVSTQLAALGSLREQLAQYEALLDVRLADVQGQLDAVDSELGKARLVAEARAEAEREQRRAAREGR